MLFNHKISAPVFTCLLLALLSFSCKNGDVPQAEECDLQDYVGEWNFVLNEDPTTLYTGRIDKYSDSTLNLTYQPETEPVYFVQVDINCAIDSIVYKQLPAGNRGTTTIEGSITQSKIDYTRTKVLQTPWGEQTTITHIVGERD